jgi:hypothetical protein
MCVRWFSVTHLRDLQENVGLDGLMEDAKGPAMNPLWRRLNTFLNMAKPRMAAIMLQVRHVVGGCCVRFFERWYYSVSWCCLERGC